MNEETEALEVIRDMAMEHFAFDCELFGSRDHAAIADIGGDTADWTTIAILADDALGRKK